MLDALFMSKHALHVLFVSLKCAIPLILHIVVRQIYRVSQARSTVTTSPVSGASCYIIRGTLLQQRIRRSQSKCYSDITLLLHVIILIRLYTPIHLIHSVHNNVGVHSFIC